MVNGHGKPKNPIQEVEAWVKEYDKTLRADDPRFAMSIVVIHEEGTFSHFRSSFAMRYYIKTDTGTDTYYCIFTEHHKTIIYHFEDIRIWQYKDEKIEDSN